MKRHVVLGAGNLGISIFNELLKQGRQAVLLSRSAGWEWSPARPPLSKTHLDTESYNPDVIWNCIGQGSVEDGERDPVRQLAFNTGLVAELLMRFPKARQVHFSSDYAECPRSFYGLTKSFAEQVVAYHARHAFIVRVCNLHGPHRPGGIIEKLVRASATGKVRATHNEVAPTWTPWIAQVLVRDFERLFAKQEECPSQGLYELSGPTKTSVFSLAAAISQSVESAGLDEKRPSRLQIGTSMAFFQGEMPEHPSILAMIEHYRRQELKRLRADVPHS